MALNFKPDFFAGCESGSVLQMLADGATDAEVIAQHPRWSGDVLTVCRKIVQGELADISNPIHVYKSKWERGARRERKPRRSHYELMSDVVSMVERGRSMYEIVCFLNVSRRTIKKCIHEWEAMKNNGEYRSAKDE